MARYCSLQRHTLQRSTLIQTFLPYADFGRSAEVLDTKRLQKQLVETQQIMYNLLGLSPLRDADGATVNFVTTPTRYKKNGEPRAAGWGNHPMIRMWRGYEFALASYQQACGDELYSRPTKTGAPRSMVSVPLTHAALRYAVKAGFPLAYVKPVWLGDERLHTSHRGRMLDKDPSWYGQFGWTERPIPESEGYFWPV